MRKPDGQSRGFGYVTLDSRAAAMKCLEAPQIIENRVIDVKLAVPECSSGSTPATPVSASSSFTPTSFGGWWQSAQLENQNQNTYMYDVMPPWACADPTADFGFLSTYTPAWTGHVEAASSFLSTRAPAQNAFAPPCIRSRALKETISASGTDASATGRVLGDVTKHLERHISKYEEFILPEAEDQSTRRIALHLR